jgi:hypothetical protein
MEIGVELGGILHVRPKECGIGIDFPDSLLGVEVVLLGVLEAVVVVLYGRCEDGSLLLC